MPPTSPLLVRSRRRLYALLDRRPLLWATAAALAAAVLAIPLAGVTVELPPAVYPVGGLLGLGLFWTAYVLALPSFRFASTPLRALWTPLLIGLLAGGGVLLATLLGSPEVSTAVPARVTDGLGAVQISLVGLLETAAALVVLLSLRHLVLTRRTRTSLTLWSGMLGAITLTAFVAGFSPPGTLNSLPFTVGLAISVLLMLPNAFRLAWVAYLPLRQKLVAAALGTGLIAVLVVGLSEGHSTLATVDVGGMETPYSLLFNRSLSAAVVMVYVFGILYGVAATLSLLFHLPTADAYEQRSGERQAIRALAELARDVLDRDRLAATIAEAPVKAGLAHSAWLALVSPRTGTLAPRVAATSGSGAAEAAGAVKLESLAREASESGAPLLLDTAAADHRVRAQPGDGLGSLLVIPLEAGGQNQGALFVSRPVAGGFEADDVAALSTFGTQAALALHSAALFAEHLERERLVRELAIARRVQERLLPQSLPEIPGVEIAAAEQPALEVGGDYYDFIQLDGGCLGVIVADVAGKGAGAAFYMAELKGIFQSASRLTRSPGEFLCRANEALFASLEPGVFASAIYGVLDPASGTFTLARAGHCPAAMARADGGRWLLRGGGLGLGLDPGPLFERSLEEQSVSLKPGDAFVLYSDGLVETRRADGEEFGYDRLADTLAAGRGEPAEALCASLLAACADFAGTPGPDVPEGDDLTLVVLRWQPEPVADGAAAGGDGAATSGPAGSSRDEDAAGVPFVTRPLRETATAPPDAQRPTP